MLDKKIKKQIDAYYEEAYRLAEHLTRHPEISCEEVESCRYLVHFLEKHGYGVTTPYAGMQNSFVAVNENKKKMKAVFLCEYDALPEVGHACGHSFSSAISILAALAIEKAYPELPFQIDIIGTPGEEVGGGKCIMTENGGFDGYEFAAMVHLNNKDTVYVKMPACNDRFFTFHGKAAHAAASPEQGINALNAARLYMEAMDMWRQHIPKNWQFHGIVAKGGTVPNIVPDEVSVDYYFRAESMIELWKLNHIAENCAKGAAMAVGAGVDWKQRYPDYADMYWDEEMQETAEAAFRDMERGIGDKNDQFGSSDIGNVSLKIPVFHMMIDITGGNRDIILHDRSFAEALLRAPAAEGLKDGAGILAGLAYRLAVSPEKLEKIKAAHHQYRTQKL